MPTHDTVTIVFTDLVASTETSARLGRDAADALRQTHFTLLRAAIDATGGREVKNLGDGLMVAFTSPSRALACAVAIQQAIDRHNRRAAIALAVRIGISVGEAVEEAGDFFGDPVVEAARICASADGGQILTTDLLRLLLGRHATHDFRSLGDLELKGLPDPVSVVEVRWEPEPEPEESVAIALPARVRAGAGDALFSFFGRSEELERLETLMKIAENDDRLHMALLSGEPGMGKTTLAAHFARRAHTSGATVLFGGCAEDLAVPYGPWIAALGHLVEHADAETLAAFAPVHAAALARLLPAAGERLPTDDRAVVDPETERYLLLEGVARLLTAATRRSSMIVLLDDLHWADAASLQLLRHLITNATAARVLIVATYRATDLPREHPLTGILAGLRRDPTVERIELAGLKDVEIVDLMEAAAGQALTGSGVDLAHAVSRETAGNPFFVTELLRHLGESGQIVLDDSGRYALQTGLDALALPGSVREVVANRAARLGDDAVNMLTMAAVIGRHFDVDVLAAVCKADEDTVLDVLDAAAVAALVAESPEEPGRFHFVHALVQHALAQDLGATRRQRAHLRIAQALEDLGSDTDRPVEELARHWLAATRPADTDRAMRYAQQAGDRALEALAPIDALRWYRQAVELLDRATIPDDALRCVLLTNIARAEAWGGEAGARETWWEASRLARQIGDKALLLAVARAGAPGMHTAFATEDTERQLLLDAALTAVGEGDSADRAYLLAALAHDSDHRKWQQRNELASEAVRVARSLDDDLALARTLALVYSTVNDPDSLDARRADTAAAMRLAIASGDVNAHWQSLWNHLHTSMTAGDIVGADDALDALGELADRTGLPFTRFNYLMARSWRELLRGDIPGAAAAAEEFLTIGGRLGAPWAEGAYGSLMWRIGIEQGRAAELTDYAVAAAELVQTIPGYRGGIVETFLAADQVDEAERWFDRDAANGFSEFAFDTTWTGVMTQMADGAVTLARRPEASLLYERLLPYASQVVDTFATIGGSVARALGRLANLLEQYDDADVHFDRALAVHERLQAPFWIARTKLDRADLSLARGARDDADRAHDDVAEATVIADRFGYEGLRRRAATLS